MVADRAAALATDGGSPSATIRLGPCVDAIMPGATSALMRAASERAPVNRKGVGVPSAAAAGSEAAARVAARMRRCWFGREAETKVKRVGSTRSAASSSASSCAQRKGYCAVCERESTTTGMPSSRQRSVLRQRSRKCEKLETQGTRTGRRGITISPAASASHMSSLRRISTGLAWCASSNSVTPSCFPKSTSCAAIISPARCSSRRASRRRMAGRRSARGAAGPSICLRRASISSVEASSCAPLVAPKASTVRTRSPPSRRFPPSSDTIGEACHEAGPPLGEVSATRRPWAASAAARMGAVSTATRGEKAAWYAGLAKW
mmetsp:Transcript_45367/g.147436  ORF Transcript_45367/g.147436 Transcript_45367/m.147436 type:complete len:320 (-) Transcript_45367:49-1008(-)